MGLKLIPELDTIFLLKRGEVDVWGKTSIKETKEELKCLIRGTETSTSIESTGGRMVLPTFDISFNGAVPINVGDYVEIEGFRKIVLVKTQKKDLSRTVLITKITV